MTYAGATLRLRLYTRREGPKESHQMLGVTWSEFPALICRLSEHSKICKPPLSTLVLPKTGTGNQLTVNIVTWSKSSQHEVGDVKLFPGNP